MNMFKLFSSKDDDDSYGWERKEYYQNHDFNKLCKNYWIFNQNEDVMDNSPQYYNFS